MLQAKPNCACRYLLYQSTKMLEHTSITQHIGCSNICGYYNTILFKTSRSRSVRYVVITAPYYSIFLSDFISTYIYKRTEVIQYNFDLWKEKCDTCLALLGSLFLHDHLNGRVFLVCFLYWKIFFERCFLQS